MCRDRMPGELDRGHYNNCGSLPQKMTGYSDISDSEKVQYLAEVGNKLQMLQAEFADMWNVGMERVKNEKMFQGLQLT